ncbi:Rne/Rng family ribonuclease [Halocynthiibacter namhaensis]|uniref:Rne/Rng family ribonuclease n=1 Tax=Halocynthiibacter namhaensis TaxID=1290553 RepID=UPI0005794DD4|nr:ribonuclease E/G [Halocynthiibacter namhaensis]
MAKKMLIDATHAEETRVVVVDGNKVEEFDFESENKRQLAGSIYLAKVTRVEPSLQAAFVDYGGNRHGFLAFSEIHPDYYQIPVADREALMAEERAYTEALRAEEEQDEANSEPRRRRRRGKPAAARTENKDAVETRDVPEVSSDAPSGMEVVDLDDDNNDLEGSSPMELVSETPVDTPETGTEETPADVAVPEIEATEVAESEVVIEATSDTVETPAVEASTADDTTSEAAIETTSDTSDEVVADVDDASDDEVAEEAEVAQPTDKDESIESVADEDVQEEIRRPRKPRQRRYKIQEVVKVRQILLVQVVKEERGNKGAALTTYLSLAGRYCVLMPNTARGGGISRKITNAADRKKLKEIATEIDVPQGAGLIVRTAGAQRTKSEIKRDYEYLQRMWEQIRALTLKSIAPAKIYEEGDLIKRSIRDLYNGDIDEVIVDGEAGYKNAKEFMQMIMPTHADNVKLYKEQLPLFARFQVENYLSSMFNPTVQLKSGGYIVIDTTEALVAVDVNSGRATKENSIEDTALKTNLEAAEEVARQMRLRDLAGLLVIDFIDMDERRNNNAVEKRLKDRLKTDRARIQVGRISGFGLLEMSRQRLRPGMLEATTQPCPSCHGTGLIRSDDNLALTILRALEEEGVRKRSREVLLKAPLAVVNYLFNNKREHIAHIETRYGISIRIEADVHLTSPDFTIERFKTATRRVKPAETQVVTGSIEMMEDIDDAVEAEVVEANTDTETNEDGTPKRKRRRRSRRRGGRGRGGENGAETDNEDGTERSDTTEQSDAVSADATLGDAVTSEAPTEGDAEAQAEEKPKRRRRRKSSVAPVEALEEATESVVAPTEDVAAETEVEEKPKRRRTRKKKVDEVEAVEVTADAETVAEGTPAVEEAPKKRRTRRKKTDEAPVVAAETAEAGDANTTEPEETPKPKPRRTRKKKVEEPVVEGDSVEEGETPAAEEKPAPRKRRTRKKAEPVVEAAPAENVAVEVVSEPATETAAEAVITKPTPVAEAPVAEETPVVEAAVEPTPAPDEPAAPKRKGWWSLGR